MSEAALRSAALAYAKVADLDPSSRRWRYRWRVLRRAALRMVADRVDAVTQGRRRRWRRAVPALPLGRR
jgi:hypothetical protein